MNILKRIAMSLLTLALVFSGQNSSAAIMHSISFTKITPVRCSTENKLIMGSMGLFGASFVTLQIAGILTSYHQSKLQDARKPIHPPRADLLIDSRSCHCPTQTPTAQHNCENTREIHKRNLILNKLDKVSTVSAVVFVLSFSYVMFKFLQEVSSWSLMR